MRSIVLGLAVILVVWGIGPNSIEAQATTMDVDCALCEQAGNEWNISHRFPLFGGRYSVQEGDGFHSDWKIGLCVGSHPVGDCEGGEALAENPALLSELSRLAEQGDLPALQRLLGQHRLDLRMSADRRNFAIVCGDSAILEFETTD